MWPHALTVQSHKTKKCNLAAARHDLTVRPHGLKIQIWMVSITTMPPHGFTRAVARVVPPHGPPVRPRGGTSYSQSQLCNTRVPARLTPCDRTRPKCEHNGPQDRACGRMSGSCGRTAGCGRTVTVAALKECS
ncbi:hypothetical protein PIB30_037713 [Stylosanthes scabra]|uniref:Uncharacterized protein n=1 Tax=Stylosanthes scabra TaxID=79078 RepID=A0ABU6ZAN9_9FABA|nr:hypothetical protein [Stylosanthes scabra]